jgi:glutathione-specific gamma-glutamylcyclotransferase
MEHVEIKAKMNSRDIQLQKQAHAPEKLGDIWVFGYGSLMWNPGFPAVEHHPAIAHGVHRRLCVYSTLYRGTPEKPGLVVGLLRGGCCHGVAFRVVAEHVKTTREYLTAREQVSKIYHEVFRPVRLRDGRTVQALCYVVDRSHKQYAGKLSPEQQLNLVKDSSGNVGPNRDYVCNTAKSLQAIGVEDRTLRWLADKLRD